MEDPAEFVEAHAPELLKYLDGEAPDSANAADPLQYVDEVLAAWSDWAEGKKLSPPTDEERTFWFALYQLEELVENSFNGEPDPYEAVLVKDLARVRELLRGGAPLPDGLFASRPGESEESL